MKYDVTIDDAGQHGGDTLIEAASVDEAVHTAANWAKDGVWDEPRQITLKIWPLDADGQRDDDGYVEHSVYCPKNLDG